MAWMKQMSKRNGGGYPISVGLSTTRCKRMIRPLLSKIHSLNDLYHKYPGLLDIKFEINPYLIKYEYTSTTPPPPISAKIGSRNRKSIRRKRTYPDSDSSGDEYDHGHAINKKTPTPDPGMLEHECLSFIKPKDSFHRLKSLQPFISPELYESYGEIFQIFRNVISTSLLSHQDSDSCVSSLSSLCSMELGKSMVLSTKSTYYRVNQSVLFDKTSMAPEIRFHEQELFDDVDDWLEMEPKMIFESHRENLFLGYIVYLLIFHQKLLFLLIPVLLHWLVEEALNYPQRRTFLLRIKNLLFDKYWTIDDRMFSNSAAENDISVLLNGSISNNSDITGFWTLHKIGYWSELIKTIDVKSGYHVYSTYDSLYLQAVLINTRIDFDHFSKLEMVFLDKDWFLTNMYQIIRRCPQHPHLNDFLVIILTQITSVGRSKLSTFKYSYEILSHFRHSLGLMSNFLNLWLGLRRSNAMVFDSLNYGNNEMFRLVLQFCNFVKTKCSQIQTRLLDHSSREDKSLSNLINEYNEFNERIDTFKQVVDIFGAYFLDDSGSVDLSQNSPRDVARSILSIQNRADLKDNLDSQTYHHFLYWLVKKGNIELARECFIGYYGSHSYFHNDIVDEVRYYLFEETV